MKETINLEPALQETTPVPEESTPVFELSPGALLVCLSVYFRIDSKQLIPSIPSSLQYGTSIYTAHLDPRTREIILNVRTSEGNEIYRFNHTQFETITI